MDIYTVLKRDNAKLESLVGKLEDTGAGQDDDRRRLLDEVGAAFRAHERSADSLLPYLINDDDAEEDAKKAREEHRDAKTLLSDLEELSPSDARFPRLVAELKALLHIHVKREEDQLIPRATELISELDAEVFGRQVQSEREGSGYGGR